MLFLVSGSPEGANGYVRVWAIAVDGQYVIAITPDSAIAPTLRPILSGHIRWGIRASEPLLIIFASFPYP